MRTTPPAPVTRSATRPRASMAALLAAGVLLAACGGQADPAADPATSEAAASDATAAPGAETAAASPTPMDATPTPDATGTESGSAATVAVATTDLGDVLVDGQGMTLYVFDNDDVDTSACTEGCLATWPPLLAEDVTAGEGVTADLGTFTRDDGDVQVTVNGLPLYLYAPDTAPGDVTGQAVGDVWWVVDAAGTKITGAPASAATTDQAGYGDPDS